MTLGGRDWFQPLFLLSLAAAAVPIWTVEFLPMVDLPQHAAQVSLWRHFGDPAVAPASRYELNWFTPYLLGYALVLGISAVLPIATAIKAVVTLAVWAFPLSLLVLLRQTGGDRYWALAGVPVAFSYSFYWGFLNYLVAVPVGVALLAAGIAYAARPTLVRGLAVGTLTLILCVSHVLVCAICGLSAAFLALRGAASPSRVVWRIMPFVPAAAASLAWVYITQRSVADVHMPTEWRFQPLVRLLGLPAMWLGTDRDAWALVAGVLLLMAILLTARVRRAPLVCVAALVIGSAYALGPYFAFGTYFVAPRFAALALPALLLVLAPAGEVPYRVFARTTIVLVVTFWVATLTLRFRAFDADARQLSQVLARTRAGASLLSLNFQPTSDAIAGHVPFLHFAAWYQVEKGGELGFSFARFFPELVRYRAGAEPPMTPGLEWFPARFRWDTDGHFDYFLVRSEKNVSGLLFGGAEGEVRSVAQVGRWWLYEKTTTDRTAE